MNNQSTLAIYLKEIGNYKLLTKEQELELGRRIKEENDEDAREALINSNLRLVVSVAKNFMNGFHRIPLEDLIAEGNQGLITAVDKYDYNFGYRFSTCAVPWIKQAIMKSIADKGRIVRIPAHIIQKFNKYKKAVEELQVDHSGEEITHELIANKMGISVQELEDLLSWRQNSVSINTPIGEDEEDTLEDLQADVHDQSPTEYVEKGMLSDYIDEVLSELPERTQVIMKMRYGLGGPDDPEDWKNEHTLEQIGDYLGITRERVRQIEHQTVKELKLNHPELSNF